MRFRCRHASSWTGSVEETAARCLLALRSRKGCKFLGFFNAACHYWVVRSKVCLLLGAGYHLEIDTIIMVQLSVMPGALLLLRPLPALWPAGDYWTWAAWEKRGTPSGCPSSQPRPALLSDGSQHWPKEITVLKISYMSAIWWAGIRSEKQNISHWVKLCIEDLSAAWVMTADCPLHHCPLFIPGLFAQKQYMCDSLSISQ